MFAFQFSSVTYRITRPGLPAIMFAGRHSLEAAARQPGADLQRLQEEVASRGLEWLKAALAEMDRDCLRDMCKSAGLPVRASSSKRWLPVSELRDALLAYLASEAEKATCSEFEKTCCQTQRCLSYWKENG